MFTSGTLDTVPRPGIFNYHVYFVKVPEELLGTKDELEGRLVYQEAISTHLYTTAWSSITRASSKWPSNTVADSECPPR
jgi:hypothetical protein